MGQAIPSQYKQGNSNWWHGGEIINAEDLNRIQQALDKIVQGMPDFILVDEQGNISNALEKPYNKIYITNSRQINVIQEEEFNNIIAPAFNQSTIKSAGDYVTDSGKLYKITAAHAKNIAWADTSKEEVLAVDEISRAFSGIDELQSLNSGEIIPLIKGGFINTNTTSGVISTTPTASGVWQYAVIDCAENDIFTITGNTSGSNTNHLLWLFLKSDYTRLTHATAGDVKKDLVITAPANAAHLVVDARIGYPAFLCKGNSVQKQITDLETSIDALEPSLRWRSVLSSSMDIHDLESGLYLKNTNNTPVNWPTYFPDGMGSTAGLLVAFKWGPTYRALLYFPAKTTNRPNSAVFYQITSNTTWTKWRMLNTNQTGDSIDLNELASQYKNESEKFDTTFSLDFGVGREPMVLGMTAQYTGTTVPTIAYSLGGYTSPAYIIGDTLQPVTKEWRITPAVGTNNICTVTVTIPSGTVADITDIYLRQDTGNKSFNSGIWWQGHSGWMSLFPRDSVAGFQYAARLGFDSMVTIPKFTSDLVGVCFHDETSITIDGQSNPISGWTYAQLCGYNIGGGMRIPTLDDFFRVCANCNMSPILSVHNMNEFRGETGRDRFDKIKKISDKYNLTHKLWIKSGDADIQSAAFSVFGTSYAGIIILSTASATWGPMYKVSEIVDVNGNRFVPLGAETVDEAVAPVIYEGMYSDMARVDTYVRRGENAHCRVSVARNTGAFSGAEIQQMIDKGVTSFCQDYHCSMGLDW